MRLTFLLLCTAATNDALLNTLMRMVRRTPPPQPHTSRATFSAFKDFLAAQQKVMCQEVEALDGQAVFGEDAWTRGDGSRGLTRVIADGALVEKGCISTSFITGTLTKARAEAMCGRGRENVKAGDRFEAAALSLVLHAKSPHVPTLRGDARCFVVFDKNDRPREAWYGGGCDLTPCYLVEEDVREFHAHWRDVCKGRYTEMKATCDEYFYLPLRLEHRGVGGVFWDDDSSADADALARNVLGTMIASWAPIVKRRRGDAVAEAQRQWQLLRRGRYLEFNLLNDRGVRFGLSPDAIERIMVSAPPLIAWQYKAEPEAGSPEARLVDVLRAPRSWVSAS
jgi:coproporphyrinogen III oxidase